MEILRMNECDRIICLLTNRLRSFEGARGMREGGCDLDGGGGGGGGGLGGNGAGPVAVLCDCKYGFECAVSNDQTLQDRGGERIETNLGQKPNQLQLK
jgi:hypothetical protein